MHEISGVVTLVGSNVTKFKVGDKAGVGGIIGSCLDCKNCNQGLENYCSMVQTLSAVGHHGMKTYGGYSEMIVVDEHYAIKFPDHMSLEKGGALLCAGISVYSPMKYFGLCEPGTRMGVVGLGGLGHMAVKFAKAFGLEVTVISTSPSKKKDAIEQLGADSFLLRHDSEKMKAAVGTLDGIIDTVSAVHPLSPLIDLLTTNGKLILLSAPDKPLELPTRPLIMGRKIVAGSGCGGIKETQEMVDFCWRKKIFPDIEVIPMDYVNTAIERLAVGDVKYRFVIDIGNTLTA